MSTYTDRDESAQAGIPIMLYEFKRTINGTVTAWRYANFPINVVRGVDTFTGTGTDEAITCSELEATGEVSKSSVTITLALGNAFAAGYVGVVPDEVTSATVYRTHYDDSVKVICFKGRVVNPSISMAGVALECESIFTSLARSGASPPHQRLCTRQFGKPGCNVATAALKIEATATAISGVTVTLETMLDPLTNVERGLLVYGGVGVTLINKATVTFPEPAINLTLMRRHLALEAALAAEATVAVDLYPGCDRTLTSCALYGNVGNYGGEPGIQFVNPFTGWSSIF